MIIYSIFSLYERRIIIDKIKKHPVYVQDIPHDTSKGHRVCEQHSKPCLLDITRCFLFWLSSKRYHLLDEKKIKKTF